MYEQTPENMPDGREIEIRKEGFGCEEECREGEGSPAPEAPQVKRGLTILLYVLVDPRDGTVRYVGKTKYTLKDRLRRHLTNPRNNHLACWVRSLKELGLTPIIEEIERVEDSNDKDWQRLERYWISFYRNMECYLVNLDSGGTGGKLRSEETKMKIGNGNRGKKQSPEVVEARRQRMLGRKLTPEHVANMSKSKKGIPVGKYSPERVEKTAKALRGKKRPPRSKETCEKLSKANTGKKRSDETRANISKAQKGKKKGPYTPEHCAAISAGLKGRKTPEEVKEKQRISALKRWGKLPKDDPQSP